MAHPGHLLIRADGGEAIGLGHVMRCLALAQEWRERSGTVALMYRILPEVTRERLHSEGIELVEIPSSISLAEDGKLLAHTARERKASVVIDGYVFDGNYQRIARSQAGVVMVIDDHGGIGAYDADLILDQNFGASPAPYSQRPNDSVLLLGTRYTLLRAEFRRHPRPNRANEAHRILITFGGSDRTMETAKAIRAVLAVSPSDLKVRVVVGAGSPAAKTIDGLVNEEDWIRVEHAVADMAPIIAWADVAISAAGSVCWEFAYMGLPMLLVPIAANQESIARSLANHGAAVNLGFHTRVEAGDIAEGLQALLTNSKHLRTMAVRGLEIVDGCGPQRVVDAILDRDQG